MGIREEDFREGWPHALAQAMTEAANLIAQVKSVQGRVEQHAGSIADLAEAIPKWSDEAGKRLQQIADTQITRIEATHSALVDTQIAFNHQMKEAMSSIQKKIDEFDAKLLEAYRAKTRADSAIGDLEKKRVAFNNLSLWDRIFKRI